MTQGNGDLCGRIDLKGHGVIRGCRALHYDPEGHGDLFGQFHLVYDPKRSRDH